MYKPLSFLYPKTYKLILISLVLFFTSCSKSSDSDSEVDQVMDPEAVVTIESMDLFELANVNISASVENIASSDIKEFGFCWDSLPDPTTAENFLRLSSTESFSGEIDYLKLNTSTYFKAFVKRQNNTVVYSPQRSITTENISVNWHQTYNTEDDIAIVDIIPANDDGFLMLLKVFQEFGPSALWTKVIKLDLNGNVLWDEEYNVGEYKEGLSIKAVGDGYIVANKELGGGHGISLLKIDEQGNLLEDEYFKLGNIQGLLSLVPDTGGSMTLNLISYDEFNSEGNRLNTQLHSIQLNNSLEIIDESSQLLDPENNLTKSGFMTSYVDLPGGEWLVNFRFYSEETLGADLMIQKYTADNNLIWQQTYRRSGEQYPSEIGNYYNGNITSLVESNPRARFAPYFWILEIDPNSGIRETDYSFRETKHDPISSTSPSSIATNSNGQYYLVGDQSSLGTYPFLGKLDKNGQPLWEFSFINEAWSRNFITNKVLLRNENEIYLFGRISDSNNKQRSIFTIKVTH